MYWFAELAGQLQAHNFHKTRKSTKNQPLNFGSNGEIISLLAVEAVEGLGTIKWNGLILPNLRIFFYKVKWSLGDRKLRFLLISWSTKNGNYILQSLNQVDVNLKPRVLIKSGYHILPSPSTALVNMKWLTKYCSFDDIGIWETDFHRMFLIGDETNGH